MKSLLLRMLVLSVFSGILLTGMAFAQDQAAAKDQPIEISADKALEWDRINKKYLARGNAIARQNDMEVKADELVAEYREGADNKTEIYRLTATGNVVLTSAGNKAYGEKAVYEVDTATATLTGKDLRIEGKDMILTAQEKFEYFSTEGRMVAIGAPVITSKGSKLTADKITAWTNSESGSARDKETQLGNLKRAEAEGHVVITTEKEKATSDKAVYTGETDTVELLGNVKLNQGQNILEGSRADMNLTTNLSRIFGAPEKGGRVKGVFFPSSAKNDGKVK